MDPVALGPEHLTALAYDGQAGKALEAICERAERHIANQFRAPDATGPRTGCYGEEYWATWGDGTWLEWHILRRGGHGPLEIRAGVCAAKRAQFDPDLERKLTQGIPIGGGLVVFDRWTGPRERLMRVAPAGCPRRRRPRRAGGQPCTLGRRDTGSNRDAAHRLDPLRGQCRFSRRAGV